MRNLKLNEKEVERKKKKTLKMPLPYSLNPHRPGPILKSSAHKSPYLSLMKSVHVFNCFGSGPEFPLLWKGVSPVTNLQDWV